MGGSTTPKSLHESYAAKMFSPDARTAAPPNLDVLTSSVASAVQLIDHITKFSNTKT